MRYILFTFIFTVLTVSAVVAQETKAPQQKPSESAKAEGEKPKNEVELMLEDAVKLGDTVLSACLENCGSGAITGNVKNGKVLHLAKP